MNVGALVCGGGSAFLKASERLSDDLRSRLFAVTDRPCEAEERVRRLGIRHARISHGDGKVALSRAIAETFIAHQVVACLVIYDRLLSEDLFERFPCINIHPSLLPAYTGKNAVARAVLAGEPCIGCTAHLIDAGIDTGPRLAQVISKNPGTVVGAEHVSFKQKAYLAEEMLRMLLAFNTFPVKSAILQKYSPPKIEDLGI